MLIVHAGHRVVAAGAEHRRFPPDQVDDVAERLELLFRALSPRHVVSAAAAGADLLALEAARRVGAATTIALPLPRAEFLRRSVADRGGEWVERFEEECRHAERVVEADLSARDDWYLVGNEVVLDVAAEQADGAPVLAVAVRAPGRSATDDLVDRAARRGWPCVDLDPSIDRRSRRTAPVGSPSPRAALVAAAVDLDLELGPVATVEPEPDDLTLLVELGRQRDLLSAQLRRSTPGSTQSIS